MRHLHILSALRTLVLASVVAAVSAATAADRDKDFPGIKALMGEAEFSAAGLEQLSPEQLRALDAWLLRYTAGDAEVLQGANEAVREAQKEYEVSSRLSADFDGWSGDTVFRLENGQVWRQRLDGNYVYRGPPSPEVRISRNFLGFFQDDPGRGRTRGGGFAGALAQIFSSAKPDNSYVVSVNFSQFTAFLSV